MERTVLVIDQDRRVFGVMLQALREVDFAGHLVLGECGLSRMRQYEPSLVVVSDNCLGLDPRRRLRQLIAEIPAPFLVICSMRDGVSENDGGHIDTSAALTLGALDGLYRGDGVDLVRARTRRACQLARALYPSPSLISLLGDVQLHVSRRQLISPAGAMQLGHIEARIMAALARAQGNRVSRSDLFEAAWRDELEPNDRRLDVRISAINHKLSKLTEGRGRIACIRNQGYSLSEDPPVKRVAREVWVPNSAAKSLSPLAISAN
jgi:DNA-binding response OmpR family regulator